MEQIMVFSNGMFKPVEGTPFEDVQKEKGFRQQIPFLKRGKIRQFRGRSFKIVEVGVKA